MDRILVTGAAGFIGSHLCEALLARGDHVVGLDNFDKFYDRSVKHRNLAECRQHPNFRLVDGDIRDAKCVSAALEGETDVIVHLAAKAGVRPSIEQPLIYQEVNVGGTSLLLEQARQHDVKRFVFASSSSVYGNNEGVPFRESDRVDHPISFYAATKKAGELICHTYWHLYGINMTCLRFFTVYGPRQRPDLAIFKFTRQIDSGEPIQVFGDGSMMRDFTFINDIVAGVMAAIDRCEGYHIYNLGESRPIRLDALIVEIERALDKQAIIQRMPMQPGDVQRTFADVSLAHRELGFEPSTDFSEGIARFVEWYRREGRERA